MKKSVFYTLGSVIVLLAVAYGVFSWQQSDIDKLQQQVKDTTAQLAEAKKQAQQPTTTYHSKKDVELLVFTPLTNQPVSSPLLVMGEVPGNWSFEASFPVTLKDSNGNAVTQSVAQVIGDWMTDRLVPFTVQLTFPSLASGNGTLVLQKDNPSGLADNEDSVSIPIKF